MKSPMLIAGFSYAFITLCGCHSSSEESSSGISETSKIGDTWPAFTGITLDSVYLKTLEEKPLSHFLNPKQVKELTNDIRFPELGQIYLYDAVQDFYTADSLAHVDSVRYDIGMIQNSEAFPVGKKLMGDKTLLIWAIRYKSFEACPFYMGVNVYLSILSDKRIVHSTLLASNWSISDPPMFARAEVSSEIEGKLLHIKYHFAQWEEDENPHKIEDFEKEYAFDFQNGTFKQPEARQVLF